MSTLNNNYPYQHFIQNKQAQTKLNVILLQRGYSTPHNLIKSKILSCKWGKACCLVELNIIVH